jgi:hypothetical protein
MSNFKLFYLINDQAPVLQSSASDLEKLLQALNKRLPGHSRSSRKSKENPHA